jgi:hypothetical protein
MRNFDIYVVSKEPFPSFLRSPELHGSASIRILDLAATGPNTFDMSEPTEKGLRVLVLGTYFSSALHTSIGPVPLSDSAVQMQEIFVAYLN